MSERTMMASDAQLPQRTLHTRSRFFLYASAMFLLINLVGFSATYYLKVFFDTPELPLRTHIHGPLFTAWFILFIVQTSLIARRRIRLHRRLGIVGAVLAFMIVMMGLVMLYYRAQEYQDPGRSLVGTAVIVWGNIAGLTGFSIFVGLGIYFRRQPEAHKRLMLLASIAMMPQALGRIGRMPILNINEVIFAIASLVVLLLLPMLYDLIVRKRLHPVSLWGPLLFFGFVVFCALVVPGTEEGQSLILLVN